MIPRRQRDLSQMLAALRRDDPCSHEVNVRIGGVDAAIAAFEAA
jgi:hypothetical protein